MSNASPTTWWGSELYDKLSRDLNDVTLPIADVWMWSIAASGIIGLAGVIPLFVIPQNYTKDYTNKDSSCTLQLLLSFAVGGLLGDVFLHLLPEAWTAALQAGLSPHEAFNKVGICVLVGVCVFIVVEMLASADEGDAGDERAEKVTNTHVNINNNLTEEKKTAGELKKEAEEPRKIKVVGYLNLIANGIDNFAHGLAVAGSFMVSLKTGLLTTSAILIHEVPHEIGDFAILLNSGFTRWEAAKAQLYTAFIGLLGALFTLSLGSSSVVDGIQIYILGFTAGAFLNISLVSVLPQLLHEDRPGYSAAQLLSLVLGVYVMAAVAC